MNLRKLITCAGIAALTCALAIGLAQDASAQSTRGKIAGEVNDASSGEALPGVNVVVVDTRLGGATGVTGEYFILQVPPGTYDIRASLVGFQTVTAIYCPQR